MESAAAARNPVMFLNSMGDARFSEQRALHSARQMDAARPVYRSTLVVGFPPGTEHYRSALSGRADYED